MQHKDETTPRSSFRQYSPLLLALLFCPLVNILRMPTSDACDQAISTQIRSDSIVGDDLFLGFPTTADDVVRRNRLPSTTQEIVYIGDHVKSAVDAIAQSINKVNHVHDSMNEDSFRQLSSQAAYQQSLLNDAELLAPMDYEPLRSNGVDHFHRLPLRKYGVSSHQISSRDTNYNNQDFSHFITVKDNTLTLFEDFGSGCIERIYLAYTAYAHRRSMEQWVMSITVDGQIVFKEQVRMIGSTFKNPFIYPLSGTTESQNGFYLYNPIFYKKHCLITVKTVKNHYPKDKDPRTLYALGFYHIFSFQKFHFDVSKDTTPTYQGVSENITSHLELASKYLYGSFKDKPAPLTRLTKHQTYAGQQIIDQQSKEFILAEHKGSGAIVGLYMNIIDGTKEHFESFVVELKFDSLEDMKTSVPFGMLFGSEHGKYETRSVTVGFTPGKGGYILFPMPFWSGFRVSIITQPNASMKLPVAVSFQFDFTHSVYPKERTGYFRANYHADRDMGPYMFPMLVVPHGWGHIVGLYMVMKRNNSLTRELGSPFEGNDFSFIDGSKSPQVPGTGTEDFFNVAHFFRDWNSTSHMFHGNPHFEYEDHKVYHAAAYRILLSDYIIYRKSIKFLMEHGPGTFSAPRADYASVVYHYQGIGHGLVNTDLLTPRDEKSAKDHSYTYEGPTKASEMNLDLVKEKWGPPYANPPQSPHGYIYAGGIIQFDVKVQPENKGVLLRRVLDYKHQNQMAEVYVDGKLAVTWYTPKFSQKFRISESEVWLPKELTQGKSSLHVKELSMSAAPVAQSRRPEESLFKQQQLPAWQPVLTPKSVILTFFSFAVIFIPIGVVILVASDKVVESDTLDYTNCKVTNDICYETLNVPKDMEPPVYVYYELTNFYQNHRRYVKSRNDDQLRGKTVTSRSSLEDCDPLIENKTAEGGFYNPCGLIANSFFNDTFTFMGKSPLLIDETGIAWESDRETKFKSPSNYDGPRPRDLPNFQGEDFENEHFMVWMRTAGLPDFRKLYGKINTTVAKGNYNVSIKTDYDVKSFGGSKRLVLSTTTWIGGKNDFLAYAYIIVGVICAVLGFLFLLKNHFSPRQLGDPRYLAWNRAQ